MDSQTHDPMQTIAERSRRREGRDRQAPLRAAETATRRLTASACDALTALGRSRRQACRLLHVPARTMRRWRWLRRGPPSPQPRGRPRKESPTSARLAALQWLQDEGAHNGLPTLRARFPGMPRCELADLLADYRAWVRGTKRISTETLTWRRPGAVWAMDHVEPSRPVDGVYDAILAVRDLGSGMQLAWLPVLDQKGVTTCAVLEPLLKTLGPPLIFKSDNGSGFKSEEVQTLLSRNRVVWLPSPAYMPWYNGSCESSNNHMQVRTRFFASKDGDAEDWTEDCLEEALRQANELPRQRGVSPAERWATRKTVTDEERDKLETRISTLQREIAATIPDFNPNNRNHQHQVLRQAVRRASLDDGLLTAVRRSITSPIKPKKAAKI